MSNTPSSNLYGAEKPVIVMPGTEVVVVNANPENPNAGIDV